MFFPLWDGLEWGDIAAIEDSNIKILLQNHMVPTHINTSPPDPGRALPWA